MRMTTTAMTMPAMAPPLIRGRLLLLLVVGLLEVGLLMDLEEEEEEEEEEEDFWTAGVWVAAGLAAVLAGTGTGAARAKASRFSPAPQPARPLAATASPRPERELVSRRPRVSAEVCAGPRSRIENRSRAMVDIAQVKALRMIVVGEGRRGTGWEDKRRWALYKASTNEQVKRFCN